MLQLKKSAIALFLSASLCMASVPAGGVTAAAAENAQADVVTETVLAGEWNETVLESGEMSLHKFVPEADGTYCFYSIASGDTYGYVYDENYNLLYFDNDGGEDFNFKIDLSLQAGVPCYLSVGYFLENESGTITWRVEQSHAAVSEDAAVEEPEESLPEIQEETRTEEETEKETEEETEEETGPDVSENLAQTRNDEELPEENKAAAISNEYEYRTLEDGTVEITQYKGTGASVTIPSKIEGKEVSIIGELAFASNEEIESVTIPNTVTKTQYASFISCKNLKNVYFQKNSKLSALGGATFQFCSSLENIEIPEGNIEIGQGKIEKYEYTLPDGSVQVNETLTKTGYVFDSCTWLKNIVIPEGVVDIKGRTFGECENLTQVTLPQSLRKVEYGAFIRCTGLRNIFLPENVENIVAQAFSGCSSLEEVLVDDRNAQYSSRDGVLYNKNKTELLYYPAGKKGGIQLPESVTVIGNGAFFENKLTNMTIPEGVTEIKYEAFSRCRSLKNISLPNSMSAIRSGAFSNCDSLESFAIPVGVALIESGVVRGCAKLADITVDAGNPNYTASEGMVYTKDMKNLVCCPAGKRGSIALASSTEAIDSAAFSGCSALTEISIPEHVQKLGDSLANVLFSGCSSLTDIHVDTGNPNYASSEGILYSKDLTKLICCPSGKSGKVVIPDQVRTIGWRAFDACGSLNSVVIPNTVSEFERDAFTECKKLVLHVIHGSTAENYAKTNKLSYNCEREGMICYHNYAVQVTKASASKNGSLTKQCTICGKTESSTIIYAASTIKLSKTAYTYNGKEQQPSVTVQDSKGTALKKDADYTISYSTGRKNVGSYTVSIKFRGNYIGTFNKTFTIRPKPTVIAKIQPKSKGFKVTWKKQTSQTTGYEVQYSVKNKFAAQGTWSKNIAKNKNTSITVSAKKASQKYYVRVRTYKTIKKNGKSVKIYSSWSKSKSVVTKKAA